LARHVDAAVAAVQGDQRRGKLSRWRVKQARRPTMHDV
jgi:hypothetical protein